MPEWNCRCLPLAALATGAICHSRCVAQFDPNSAKHMSAHKSPLSEIVPGVPLGSPDEVFGPAFWGEMARVAERGDYGDIRLGTNLAEEVAACLLGGFGMPAEMATRERDRSRNGEEAAALADSPAHASTIRRASAPSDARRPPRSAVRGAFSLGKRLRFARARARNGPRSNGAGR